VIRELTHDGRSYTIRVHHIEGPDPLNVILSATSTADPDDIGYAGYTCVRTTTEHGWRWAQVGDIVSDPSECLEMVRDRTWNSATPDPEIVALLEWARGHTPAGPQ
jgi:hypothetical protein